MSTTSGGRFNVSGGYVSISGSTRGGISGMAGGSICGRGTVAGGSGIVGSTGIVAIV